MADPINDTDTLAATVYEVTLARHAAALSNQIDAEEIANRVALEICTRPTFWLERVLPHALGPIVDAVAKVIIADWQRSEREHHHAPLDLVRNNLAAPTEEAPSDAEFERLLDGIGSQLTVEERGLLDLVRSEQTSTEIAKALGVTPSTAVQARMALGKKICGLLGVDAPPRGKWFKAPRVERTASPAGEPPPATHKTAPPPSPSPKDTPPVTRGPDSPNRPAGAREAGEPESVEARAVRILRRRDVRDSDYLRLPPSAMTSVEREFELVQAMRPGVRVSDAERARIHSDRTLEHHFGGQVVACVRTNSGVIVLATGEEAIGALVRAIPGSDWKGVAIEFPPQHA